MSKQNSHEELMQGAPNSHVLATIQNIVKNPGISECNPLFIYGGDGKAHLMQAIGNELHENNPHLSICHLGAETFLNEYVEALKNKQIASFRKKYRSVDVLMIDDIHFLQNNMRFQEEFFNTFDVLLCENKQIVLTSNEAPQNLPLIAERLVSRLASGMVVGI